MILGNEALLRALREGVLVIDRPGRNWHGALSDQPPFNTSAVDLCLGAAIQVPKREGPVTIDLAKPGGVASHLAQNSRRYDLTPEQPYKLETNRLILATTLERVKLPLALDAAWLADAGCRALAARVEGKSSLARYGLLVHFTAPTIHAGFEGHITLEIINLGPWPINLVPGMPICQLIVELVFGDVSRTPNQFLGQTTPSGL